MPSQVRFPIVRSVLERKGYAIIRVTGSHHVFPKHKAKNQVTPVHNGLVKHVYYRKALAAP